MTNTTLAKTSSEFVRRFLDTVAAMPPLSDLEDDVVIAMLTDTRAEIEDILNELRPIAAMFEAEVARRLRARRTEASPSKMAIPHERLTITSERQFTPYVWDLEKLKAAAQLLTDPEERAKVIVYTPETYVPARTLPEKYEPGKTVSIAALAAKYEGSRVGNLLAAAMSRTALEDKITIALKPAALPPKRPGVVR